MLTELFKMQGGLNDHTFGKRGIRDNEGNILTMSKIAAEVAEGRFGPNDLPNEWITNYLWADQSESKELGVELSRGGDWDLQNVRVEIIDKLHFQISLALVAGMSPELLLTYYCAPDYSINPVQVNDLLRTMFSIQANRNDQSFKEKVVEGREGDILTMTKIMNDDFGPDSVVQLRSCLSLDQAKSDELKRGLLKKWWSDDHIDIQKIRILVAEKFHQLISLAMFAGLSADEFFRLYMRKHEVNLQRQETGYNQANKDEADNRSVV